MISPFRMAILEQLAEARDDRSDVERLHDAMKAHRFNHDRRVALTDPSNPLPSEAQLNEADLRFEDSEAELWRAIEDVCLCDPRELGRLLNA